MFLYIVVISIGNIVILYFIQWIYLFMLNVFVIKFTNINISKITFTIDPNNLGQCHL